MNTYQTKLNLVEIAAASDGLPFWIDGSGAQMAVKASGGIPAVIKESKPLMAAIEEIARLIGRPALHVMINRLPAGVIVPVHTDPVRGTHMEHVVVHRWHLPVVTNSRCWFWEERLGRVHMPLGNWCGPVPFWSPHSVGNEGTTPRVHLVVDLLENMWQDSLNRSRESGNSPSTEQSM